MSDVLHHALWDAWIHERDVLLPLGVSPTEEPDEVAALLDWRVLALQPLRKLQNVLCKKVDQQKLHRPAWLPER